MSRFRLPQKVTYWKPLSVDGNGTVTFSPGIAVKARWMRKDGTTTDEQGAVQQTTHVVYSRTLIPKRARIQLSDMDKVATPPTSAREVIGNVENESMSDMFVMVL